MTTQTQKIADFKPFSDQINNRFNAIQKDANVFISVLTGDALYDVYLASFPEGTNPIFRERTEHDCSNCKNFIRNFGGVISINTSDLSISTIWDGKHDYPYDVVSQKMREAIIAAGPDTIFRTFQATFSQQRSTTLNSETMQTASYHHFYGSALPKFVTRDDSQVGEYNTGRQVLTDSFQRLNLSAVSTVLDLINENQLYRGTEHKAKVEAYKTALTKYNLLDDQLKRVFIALNATNPSVARFKNSVIGTLVEDIASGVELERAVRSFETKVAPQNYQRTSQIVSQKMVDSALETINGLGLSIERRMANLRDVSINNVLWSSGEAQPMMKDGLAGLLAGSITTTPVKVDEKNATDIKIDDFINGILPTARGLRLLVAPDLANNFMTLTTAVHEDAGRLFKWDNNFAWAYSGGTTDMISERVKAAGGNINAALRFSLSWFNYDDLDLHVTFTGVGRNAMRETIYFRHRGATTHGLNGGLDVDMNAGGGTTRTPVENIAFTTIVPGTYEVKVNNYSKREQVNTGFTLQVADTMGSTDYTREASPANGSSTICLTATVDAAGNVTYSDINQSMKQRGQTVTGKKWGLDFGQFAEVQAVMLSPNHWDGQNVGNKHTFFSLKDARADEALRGIFNEYLNNDLAPHRKVFDLIGEKTKPPIADDQLSGIGISSTLQKAVIAEVTTANSRRLFKIVF